MDVLRFIQRSVKRAGINAKYSEGFNPHMKTSFGYPLSLGVESVGEYFEIELNECMDTELFINKLNAAMPKEMQAIKADLSDSTDSLMKRSAYVQYLINFESDIDVYKLNGYFKEMIEEGVIYNRHKKNKKNKPVSKELNTKELLNYLHGEKITEGKLQVQAIFKTDEEGSMKVDEFINLLSEKGFCADYYTIMKVDSLDKEMTPLL